MRTEACYGYGRESFGIGSAIGMAVKPRESAYFNDKQQACGKLLERAWGMKRRPKYIEKSPVMIPKSRDNRRRYEIGKFYVTVNPPEKRNFRKCQSYSKSGSSMKNMFWRNIIMMKKCVFQRESVHQGKNHSARFQALFHKSPAPQRFSATHSCGREKPPSKIAAS